MKHYFISILFFIIATKIMAMENTTSKDFKDLSLINLYNLSVKVTEAQPVEAFENNHVDENLKIDIISLITKHFKSSFSDVSPHIDADIIKRLFTVDTITKLNRLFWQYSDGKSSYTYSGDTKSQAYLTTIQVNQKDRVITLYGFLYFVVYQYRFNKEKNSQELYDLIQSTLQEFFFDSDGDKVAENKKIKNMADRFLIEFKDEPKIEKITQWIYNMSVVEFLITYHKRQNEGTQAIFRTIKANANFSSH